MNLSILPTEITWTVLEHLTKLTEKKTASLVCSGWNKMLFSSPKAQQSLKLRICGQNRSRTDDHQQFVDLFDVMIASERNYVNIEFCYVNFDETPISKDFLLFIVTVCSQSLRCLRFESCGGLSRSFLLTVLRKACHLEELHVINRIARDDIEVQPFSLAGLRKISVYINNDCPFHDDICWLAPGLEELNIRTRGFTRTLRCVSTVEQFSAQLRKIEYTSETLSSCNELMMLRFKNLVHLKLDVPNSLNSKFVEDLHKLEFLELKGNISEDLIYAACTIPGLKCLTLRCNGLYECSKFSQLSKLSSLNALYLTGIYNYSWKNIELPSLKKLHVQSVGMEFPELLKRTTVTSLEIHDDHLSNKLLKKICLSVPKLERLELAKCRKVTDSGLKHIPRLAHLRELRLWEIGVSSKLIKRWRSFPKLKRLIIYFNNWIDDAFLADIADKGTHLEQVVFYDCYNISLEAAGKLKERRPDCDVLRIYRGGPLPESLMSETQIYCRSVDYPYGVLKLELPFSWEYA